MKTIKSLTEAEITELPKLPDSWTWTKLGEIAYVNSGNTPKSLKEAENKGQFPFYKVSDMNSEGNETWMKTSNLYLTNDEKVLLKVKEEQKGTIIFPKRGGAILTNKKRRLSYNASYDLNIMGVKEASKHILNDFLWYWFSKLDLRKLYDGSNVPQINNKDIEPLLFPLPPLLEQRAIVSKIEQLFSELENGIANLKLAKEQLKVYRQAVLKKAFEGELTKKWREQQTDLPAAKELLEEIRKEREKFAKASGIKIKDIEGFTGTELADFPKIPDRWKWVKLQELCNLIGGVTKGRKLEGKKTVSLPYLRVANVQDGYLDLSEIKYIDALEGDLDKYCLMEGDILYTEGGDKDKLGRGTIWKGQIENCIHQNHIFRARPYSNNLVSSYIGYFSQTQTAKNYFFKNGKQTVNLASINLTVLSNLPFPLCSLPEQQAIVQEIETRLSVCDKIEQDIETNLEKAEALRQSILKKAFEGKLLNERELVEVRGAEDWEPAEILMERIRVERTRK